MTVMERTHDTPETTRKPGAISLKNVLFATDFSPTSESALPYAAAICRRFGSTLHVAHVLSDANLLLMTGGVDYVCVGTVYEDAQSEAKEKIQQITTRLGKIPCQTYIRHGQVWTNLSSIVAANAIDLIVVGTRGRSGLGTLLLGSVAEQILRHAPCPVLTVGPKVCGQTRQPDSHPEGREPVPAELELRQIVYATNLNVASLTVAPVAIGLAEEFKSRLTLLHVLEQGSEYANLDDRPGPIERGIQQLQTLVPKDAALAYAPEMVMEFGAVPQNILYAAAQREADLIVLGARPAEHATHLPWSTVHQVVAYATCPVLTVRAA
jgi:nucleotide-binding universal stress UspA family protein